MTPSSTPPLSAPELAHKCQCREIGNVKALLAQSDPEWAAGYLSGCFDGAFQAGVIHQAKTEAGNRVTAGFVNEDGTACDCPPPSPR